MFSSWQTAWPLLFYPKKQILALYDPLFKEIENKTGVKIDCEAEIIDIIFQIHQAAVGDEFDQEAKDLNRNIYGQLNSNSIKKNSPTMTYCNHTRRICAPKI